MVVAVGQTFLRVADCCDGGGRPADCLLHGAGGGFGFSDGHLVVLGDGGRLALVEATPAGYQEVASARVLNGLCWTAPTLADGKLYIRDDAEIVCLDVKGQI